MTEGAIEGGGQQEGQQQNGMNPDWNDILGAVPADAHQKLIPALQGYDQKYQSKLQDSTRQYEGYKDFLQYDPENIRIALSIAQALDENPQGIYEALAQDYGPKDVQETGNKGTEGQLNGPNDSDPYAELPPQFVDEFRQLKQNHDAMKEILLHQHNEEQQAKEDQEYDQFIKGLMEKDQLLKELNKDGKAEPFIHGMAMAGYDEKAISDEFANFVDMVVSYHNRPKPPTMLGVGGFMPENQTKPSQLTDQQRNQLAVQMLQHVKNS